jgi:hypothetical protein
MALIVNSPTLYAQSWPGFEALRRTTVSASEQLSPASTEPTSFTWHGTLVPQIVRPAEVISRSLTGRGRGRF